MRSACSVAFVTFHAYCNVLSVAPVALLLVRFANSVELKALRVLRYAWFVSRVALRRFVSGETRNLIRFFYSSNNS